MTSILNSEGHLLHAIIEIVAVDEGRVEDLIRKFKDHLGQCDYCRRNIHTYLPEKTDLVNELYKKYKINSENVPART